MNIHWTCKHFSELSTTELYHILQLRSEVFVVEQNCPYLDADDKDFEAYHLCAWQNNKLVAYTRLLAPGATFAEASIGRVVTAPVARGSGIGKELMQRSIEAVYKIYGGGPIQIGAQLYLKKFYTALGFEAIGDVYLEDNIEHIHMIKP